jgi:ribosomal protein S18 acetylase RimI-like enzyme
MEPVGQISCAARLEHLAHRTWPCAEEAPLGGWILRAAQGFSRRANSVLASGPWPVDPDTTLERIRTWYDGRGIEPCLKITPLAPDGLDERLDADGWAKLASTRVMRRDLSSFRGAPDDPRLGCTTELDPGWLRLHARWEGESPRDTERNQALLLRMPSPLFLTWEEEGEVRAVMVASRWDGRAHLYSLVVDPSVRGRGVGRRFLVSCLEACAGQGLEEVVLQVLESNQVARGLYTSLGFSEAYGYHYRVAMQG